MIARERIEEHIAQWGAPATMIITCQEALALVAERDASKTRATALALEVSSTNQMLNRIAVLVVNYLDKHAGNPDASSTVQAIDIILKERAK